MLKYFTLAIFVIGLLLLTVPAAHAACPPTMGSPMLSGKATTTKGVVDLMWNPQMEAKRYALVFGFPNMSAMFGALHVDGGATPMYRVTHLASGVNYNFQVWSFCDDNEAPMMSNWVTIKAP